MTTESQETDAHHAHAEPTPSPAESAPSADTHDAAAPPLVKRARREYPWRPEYARDFGVRPVQHDAASGFVLLVECCFCVAFGREAPPARVRPVVSKDGQPVKTRARTRNVAHWKYPFRTDNMRSHHLQQHPTKWKEYAELLERAKQDQLTNRSVGAGGVRELEDHELRIRRFFGDGEATQATVAAPALPAVSLTARPTMKCAVRPTSAGTLTEGLSKIIRNTAIVDVLLPKIVDIPDSTMATPPKDGTELPVFLQAQPSSNDDGALATHQYVVSVPDDARFRLVRQLLVAGLRFSQVVDVAHALHPDSTLTRGEIAAYSRAIVATSLQQVSDRLRASWGYSLRLSVGAPSSPHDPTALRVAVRVPTSLYDAVEELHVVTVALRQSTESRERVLPFLRLALGSLDPDCFTKVLSVTVDGARHCLSLGLHADLPGQIASLLEVPTVEAPVGARSLLRASQSAWTNYLAEDYGLLSFTSTLETLLTNLRSDGAWLATHGHCSIVHAEDAVSVYRALKWLVSCRESLPHDASAPSWWWLVAYLMVDVWASVEAAAETAGVSTSHTQEVAIHLRTVIETKCYVEVEAPGLLRSDEDYRAGSSAVEFDEMGAGRGVGCKWSRENIALCLRSLSVSTRRLFADAASDAEQLRRVELHCVRFVLHLIGCLRRIELESSRSVPPVLPLELCRAESAAVVDLVETHSRRLERCFSSDFLDRISREVRDLQTLVAANNSLRSDLQMAESFTAAWKLVPQFEAARTLATGLATAVTQGADPKDSMRAAFGRVERGELPALVLAELAVEGREHAKQQEQMRSD